ncbi:VOC family protein [Rhodovulum strictum]|uniref:VOC family protein n=1 Tax=Rhodovulum strictum TaxID=58314 RepID=A0A844BJ01_9RHOB|nr:VOC family protein [Rhodovulum strictum]MRH20943.1 VOC family protein [Rhodovulum strictum]
MRFRYTILYVPDVAATLDFYGRAFGMTTGFLHESGEYGELATGETKLAFSSVRLMTELGKHPGQPDPAAPVFEIAFETGDVAGAVERALAAGARLVQAPRDEPWGQTTAYVTDPNGCLVELCSPMGG